MRLALFTSVLIQGIGTLSLFALVVVISRIGGPQMQGGFATLKSWTDLLVALGQLGLPQAFVYAINKGHASPGPLFRLSAIWAIVVGFIGGGATLVAISFGYLSQSGSIALTATYLGLSAGGMTMFYLVRALLLTHTDGMPFALYTVGAPILLSTLIIIGLSISPRTSIEPAFALCGIMCAFIATIVGFKVTEEKTERKRTDYAVLTEHSASAFIISVLLVLQPVLTFAMIRWWGGDHETIGLFNVASMSVAVSNVLFAMISPVLFNRWSKSLTSTDAPILFRRIFDWSIFVGALSLMAVALAPYIVAPVFGTSFAAAVLPTQILACGLAPLFYNRIASSALLGLGLSSWNAALSGVRIIIIGLLFLWFAESGFGLLLASALAWSAAEWLTAALTAIGTLRRNAPRKS